MENTTVPAIWNDVVLAHGGSFLQSSEWGSLQESLGRRTMRVEGPAPALLIRYPLPLGLNYLYAPQGPLLGNAHVTTEGLLEFVRSVKKVPGAGHPLFLRIELMTEDGEETRRILMHEGFQEWRDAQPKETLLLDLTKSEEDLLTDMEHDTRYALRVAERRGVAIHRYTEPAEKEARFNIFWDLFEHTNARHALTHYPPAYYRSVLGMAGECWTELFTAEFQRKPIAAALVVFFGDTATYLYAASAPGYGKYNAPSLILWHAIRAAHEMQCHTFDFWGVSHEKPGWQGITAFKKSFGGTEIRRVGTWDLPLWRPLYTAYRLVKRFRR